MNNNTQIETVEDFVKRISSKYTENISFKDGVKVGLIEGINWQKEQDLPIIKKLLETLIKANLYVPPKFYGQDESVDNDHYLEIQTTLDKYKNYL